MKDHYKNHENLFTRIGAHKQDHILYHIDLLDEMQLHNFYESLYEIDFELMDMVITLLISI